MGTRYGFATRYYGSSPDTISRWARAYAAGGVPTDEDEFYQVEELSADFGGLQTALLSWDVVYEQVWPNQALGCKIS
jgi:hypothetical protein